ncbi:MAG: PBECR4 domain-containing protein [Ruminococcus sp.]|nr:PBECR4 domain-containing protein [Ruminococcus sp.]
MHYLNDIRYIRRTKRSSIFNDICRGKVDDNFLSVSTHFNDIRQRIADVTELEKFLDSSTMSYKYDKGAYPKSKINADFILKNNFNGMNTYYCIQKNSDGSYFVKSLFSENETGKDYTAMHNKRALLYKEKVNLLSGEKKILYVHPKYEEQCIHH